MSGLSPVLLAGLLVSTAVAAQSPPPFTKIVAGSGHSCALAADSTAWCWGANTVGQLGRGLAFDSLPHPDPDSVRGGLKFQSLAAGESVTCGLDATGAAFCWGAGLALGVKNPPDNCVAPRPRMNLVNPCSLKPIAVETRTKFTMLSVKGGGACGVVAGWATIYCWGGNYLGGLDARHQKDLKSPTRAVWDDRKFVVVALGDWHGCALARDATVVCWGSALEGQVGDGAVAAIVRPVSQVLGVGSYTKLSVSNRHSCGLQGSFAFCWGNGRGSPQRVAPQVGLTDIAAGPHFACGVAVGGTVVCWGTSRLRDTTRLTDVPTTIAVPERSRVIAAGNSHACVVGESGTAYCWGNNAFGQLGYEGKDVGGPPAHVGKKP